MGYYQVPNNTIFIDNQDINLFSLSSLRMKISYINQNNRLFNKTIYENIQYGNNISYDEINYLIIKYNLNTIFKNLPNGFNTNVGVSGDSLSGGQKQIIQLLRCYNKNNKILILDEPTSALDNDTRLIVLQIIKDISINSTLIIITHDSNNLSLVNRVIHLKDGKII
jgi:subfamily B ATP-binding cassette protein MsbA